MMSGNATTFISSQATTPDDGWRSVRLVARALVGTATAAVFLSMATLSASAAPGDADDGTVTANVGVSSSITLTGLTGEFTLEGLPGATIADEDAVAFNVNTNNIGGYNVTVQAETPTLVPTVETNTDSIPIRNLSVRDATKTEYTPLSNTTALVVNTKATRSVAAGDDYSHDYSVDIPFVADDTYSATLNYVATAL